MRYFLYKITSTDPAPPWSTKKDWFYYYKWGRPEVVSLLKELPHYRHIAPGDMLFLVLDSVVIGHASVLRVDTGWLGVGNGPVQELDIQGDAIWEHRKKTRLKGSWGDRVPTRQGERWVSESSKDGRLAQYKGG